MGVPVIHLKLSSAEMASDRTKALSLNSPDKEGTEERVYGNDFAELESVDLPLGTTLR